MLEDEYEKMCMKYIWFIHLVADKPSFDQIHGQMLFV